MSGYQGLGGSGNWGREIANGYGASSGADENALELDTSDGCTSCKYTKPSELYTLKG